MEYLPRPVRETQPDCRSWYRSFFARTRQAPGHRHCGIILWVSEMSLNIKHQTVPLQIDADGVARVGHTRVPLDTVVDAFLEGATPEEVAQQYPSLQLGDIYATISFYLRHKEEVDEYLDQRLEQAKEVRKENESRFPPLGIRERLLSRRNCSS